MDGFKNTTRMKTFGDEAPQAYAKGGSVKPMAKAAAKAPAKAPMKKANGGDISKMRPDQRLASMEKSSRAMTPAETRSMQALKAAKAAAPKQGPLIKSNRQMTPAERRMNQMDRPTNNMGAEAYKGGGKVGGSKVPFAVKKVMRKAEGGAVSVSPPAEVYTSPSPNPDVPQEPTPQSVFGTSPGPMPTMPQEPTMPTMPPMPSEEPTPQSVFLPKKVDPYGTSPGPMPVMPNEPMMPSAPKPAFDEKDLMDLMGSGGSQQQLIDAMNARIRAAKPNPLPGSPPQRQFYDYVYTPENSPEMFAADRARVAAAQAAQADRAATLQAQQEMAAQAQQDRGLGLDLGGRRNLAPSYGRNPYLPRS
jgi:hypothetical protein